MSKQVNVRFNDSEPDLKKWADAQNSVSGSVKLLIRQAVARYGSHADIQEALIRESINYSAADEQLVSNTKTT